MFRILCRELRLRQSYVEHLENLKLQKEDEKEALQKHVMQQVTGVYRLAEEEAVQRLAAHTKELQVESGAIKHTRYHRHPCSLCPDGPRRGCDLAGVHGNCVQAKSFPRPATKAKCQLETDAAVECYKKNSADPLACWKMVAFSSSSPLDRL